MTSSFSLQHGAMLLRYRGISFISGAVNHGFFTGGLQHFPDAPARSSWVVPLGFFVSVLALAFSAPRVWQRAATVYEIVLGACVAGGSWSAWQWLELHPEWAATGHSHDESTAPADKAHDGHDPSHLPSPLVAQVVSRSLALRMDDQMRFTPSQIDVQVAETVRFVVHNAGQTTHEMVLGTEEEIRQHAQAMQQGAGHAPGHSHGSGVAITLAAGQKGELVVGFAQAQKLQMACLIPGHYAAGMRGAVTVGIANAVNAAPPKAAQVGHGTHAH